VARVAVEDDGPAGTGAIVVGYGELRDRDRGPGGVDHLTLQFSAPDRLRRGTGRLLLTALAEAALERRPGLDFLTVNASSYAVPAYERLGFRVAGAPATRNGVTATPMLLDLGRRASPGSPLPSPRP
jgi:GNAT superfamily N-acetyltransferase